MAAKEKLKILCLHGYRQDAESFKDKMGGFRKSVKGIVEMVFINAPHVIPTELCDDTIKDETSSLKGGRSWWFCDETNSFSSKTASVHAKGFKESIDTINEAFKNQGPFHGILGFSQGAALAALICGLREQQDFVHNFHFVVVIAGFRSISQCHQYLYKRTINIKSLHIIGKSDNCISKDLSEDLMSLFEFCSVVYHDGGHFIPSHSSIKKEYIPFFKNMYCIV